MSHHSDGTQLCLTMGRGAHRHRMRNIEIGSMQLLAKLLLVAPPIDLCGHLGLDALMCGATEVMSRFCVGLVVQIIYNNR